MTNRDDLDQDYKAVVFEANKRFSQSWQMMASYTWQDSKAFGSGAVTGSTQQDFSNLSRPPATAAIRTTRSTPSGRPRPTHARRQAVGTYAPWGIQLGRALLVRVRAAVRAPDHRPQQGAVRASDHPCRGARPYALPAVNDFQLRLDKDIKFGGQQRLRFSVDFFNIFNSDTVLTLRNNSSQVTATTPWQQSLSVVRPRTVQLGVRYEFWDAGGPFVGGASAPPARRL